jgi:hypothetical protein
VSRWGPRPEQEASVAVVAGVIAFVLGAPWWLAILSGVAVELVGIVIGARIGGAGSVPDPRAGHRPTLHDWAARGPWGNAPR